MFQQLKKCFDFFLAKGDFREIVVPCNSGNHGRLTAKLRITTEHRNSIEFMIYRLLAEHYADEPRIKISAPKDTFAFVNIFDKYLIRTSHGSFLKGGGGIGGIYPSLFKWIHRQNQTTQAYLDLICHFHQLVTGRNFVINSCVVGYNAYARAMGFAAQPASQSLTFIERDLGITSFEEIYLQEWK